MRVHGLRFVDEDNIGSYCLYGSVVNSGKIKVWAVGLLVDV